MHLSVGTSLAVIIPTSFSSVRSHYKKAAVDIALLKSWAPPMVVGVILGSFLAGLADDRTLMAVFAVVALGVAANMVFGKEEWRLGRQMPGAAMGHIIAATIGGLSTMMGIGGGTFGGTIMTLFGYPVHRAVGTAAGLGVIISIPGALGFILSGWSMPGRPPFSLGYVNLVGFALIAMSTVFTAPMGAALAHSLNRKTLLRVFAFFLALTSLRMFSQLLF